jgi:peptide/nickel transport system substrate-binding protein
VKLRFLMVVASLAVVLGLAACGGDEGSGTTKDTLSLALNAEPTTLDPATAADIHVAQVLNYNVMEPLLEEDKDGELKPLLAERWDTSADGRTYTFHLRPAKFHNGKSLTADDVVATYRRYQKSESFPYTTFSDVDSIEAVDPQTVRITLKNPNVNWLSEMAKGGANVQSKESFAKAATAPVGTGPFRLASWRKGQAVVLERHDGYWGEKPAVETVTWRIITDPNAAINALRAGDIDAIPSFLRPERAGEFEADSQFKVYEEPSDTIWWLFMNDQRPPFDDPEVRRAVVQAIDQPAQIEGTQGGYGETVCGWVSRANPAFEDYCPYKFDPDAARSTLARAGHSEGLDVEINGIKNVQPNVELSIAQLADAGIRAKNRVLDDADYFERVVTSKNPDFQLTVLGYPDVIALQNIRCPPTWWTGYCSREVSSLLAESDAAADLDASADLVGQANRVLTDDAAAAPLFNAAQLAVLDSELTGYKAFRVDNEFDVRSVRWGD